MKLNDWIVAGLTNPDTTTSEFLISGLNIENTLLLSPDQYKKSSFVRDRFTQNGVFNEDAFDTFYKLRASEFGRLLTLDVQDTFLYNPLDPRAAKGNKNTMSPGFGYELVANPNKEINFFGSIYANDLSLRERALRNKVFDTATGEWSEDTLNDKALINSPSKWFKTVFGEPLVYATYDEDGEHYDTFSGKMIKHSKGQYKLDAKGNPYTETLNGRSLIGKDVVASADILTVDKEGIDKYNFFDSDDVEKSVTGTVMKTVASVAPMLMGPYVSGIYSGLLVGRELLKTLPMLYGMTTAWFDMPKENATLNKLAAYGNVFTTSTSDYGRSSMLNTEVLATLMSDVALQWGQQKFIANSIGKLRGSKDLMDEAYKKAGLYYTMLRAELSEQARKGLITKEALEKYIGNPKNWNESAIGKAAILKFTKEVEPIVKNANRLGADASLAYMALVSNTDVYSSMLEAGASRKEAAAVALGSTIGMFGVDKYLHLGELFFDDLTADYERQVRRTFTKEAKNWYDNVIKQTVKDPEVTKFDKFRRLFQSGVDFGKKHISQFAEDLKYHSTGFLGKALGEGLEEVSEELVADVSKGIYELMGELGLDTTVKDVGAFDNALARYGMSFLGGTLGGGLFYGVNLYLNGKFHVDLTQDELIYLVRNGKTDEALKTLEEWRKKGKLGSTSLSTEITQDSNGNDVFVTAKGREDSLNEFIYKRIKETILSLENVINENRANLNEDLLFENMILSEVRFKDLQKYLDKQKSNLNLQEFSYTTGYQRDYQKALSNVIDLEESLKLASRTKSGLPSTEDEIASDEYLRNMTEEETKRRSANLKMVQELLKEAKDELDRFLSGEYSINYTEKMLFALDNHLNEDFVAMTYELWLKKNHDGKTPDTLSQSESEKYKEEYLNYKKAAQALDLDLKFAIYKAIKEQMNPVLLQIQEGQENFKKFLEAVDKLMSKDSPIFKLKMYKENDILDFAGETKDSDTYINRNLKENRELRLALIVGENRRQHEVLKNSILKIIDLAGGFIDPANRRRLKLLLFKRNKDYMQGILQGLSESIAEGNTEIDTSTGKVTKQGVLTDLDRSVLLLLEKIDIKNLDSSNKIWDEIDSLIKEDYLNPIYNKNRQLGGLAAYLNDAPIGRFQFLDDGILGTTLKTIIDNLIAKGLTLDLIFDTSNTALYSLDFKNYGISVDDLNGFLEGQNIRKRYEEGTLDSFEWSYVDSDEALNDTKLQERLTKYNLIFHEYLNELNTDPAISLNLELDARISNINPVIELVKSLGLSLNTNMENLEKILTELDKKFEETDDIDDLILASEEKESFEEAAYILKLAKSYLYAASATPNIISPFGHNATLNEFAENHKDIYKDFQPLPVLSTDVASMYEHELNNYLFLMGIKDEATGEYNAGSWMLVSNTNEANKALMFIRADKAWSKASYDMFAHNPDAFKFTHDGKEYNLLEGFESIPPVTDSTTDALVYLNKLFNLFHDNVNERIKEGWTYKQVWERSGLLEKICGIEKDDGSYDLLNIVSLKTSALNEHITFDRMTGYDKMVFLATVAAMDSTKFYSYLKTRVEEESGIVPLTIQEWISRVGIAQIENPEIFNLTLEYILKLTNSSLPIVYNAVYMGGNAGAGKK